MSETFDLSLQCVDCDCVFLFSAGEQEYYDRKGLTTPKWCQDCRTKKRQRREREEEKRSRE